MSIKLRDYQDECVKISVNYILKNLNSSLLVLATGAGKSIIISEIANKIFNISKKRILILAPSSELVKQNRAKYLLTGNPASIYSASLGSKCLRHAVVFGTPKSVANAIDKFGDQFGLVIVDEAHGITSSVKKIISELQGKNDKLRVLGLTATPYRMKTGYIYQIDSKERTLSPDEAVNPFFYKNLYEVTANELITRGYLTPPLIGEIGGEHYETKHLQLNNMGNFDEDDLDRAIVGQGRKTAYIVADIVAKSKDRKAVMIFATNIHHSNEIMQSLPPALSAVVTGETSSKDRAYIIKKFTNGAIKYLVNVSVLTTGFDAPIVDVIALMRPTESAGLLQQIIGRGLRLYDGKEDVLILDYAENLDRHTPDGDIFNPEIKTYVAKENSEKVNAVCPECGFENCFSARENKGGYLINENGYFTDLLGTPIYVEEDRAKPLPAHYGRRCIGLNKIGVQCSYRWTVKFCETCEAENDITARKCKSCGGELIDPNEKLRLEFKLMKKDPTRKQIDEVLEYDCFDTMSMSGSQCLKVSFVTPYRKFDVWFTKDSDKDWLRKKLEAFEKAREIGINTIEYIKKGKFYEILSYNKEEDKL